jgi:hypothetical protein
MALAKAFPKPFPLAVVVAGRGVWSIRSHGPAEVRRASARGTGTRLDGLGVDLQALFLVDEEVFHGIALVALELDHVAGLLIVHNGTVAGKLLLDDLEDFLEIELGRDALDGGQGLATIALCAGQRG